jgi:hypothetical protein
MEDPKVDTMKSSTAAEPITDNANTDFSAPERVADDRSLRAATHGTDDAKPTEPPHAKPSREEIRPSDTTKQS